MISISTITKNDNGNVVINTNGDFRDNSARTYRVKTLDGGVYIGHSGVSYGDQTLSIRTSITTEQENVLWDIFNNNTFVSVSNNIGIFLAVISSLKIENGFATMTILIKNKEN